LELAEGKNARTKKRGPTESQPGNPAESQLGLPLVRRGSGLVGSGIGKYRLLLAMGGYASVREGWKASEGLAVRIPENVSPTKKQWAMGTFEWKR
jgi:hypothetical protein